MSENGKDLVWTNTMCRDEPFCVYGILSVIDYVDKCLVIDTGSTDGTFEELQEVQQLYPDKVILERREIPNCHGWRLTRDETITRGLSEEACKALGDIRREMNDRTNAEFALTLDGDEVYPDELIKLLRPMIDANLHNTVCVFLPFFDYTNRNMKEIRQIHHMGRLFRKEKVKVVGSYPSEVHYSIETNQSLEMWSNNILVFKPASGMEYVCHLESVLKPDRKEKKLAHTLPEKLIPQVIYRYMDKFPRIKDIIDI